MTFPLNNLPTPSVPWGREVEKQLSAATLTIASNERNNAARDNQLAASLTRVNKAATDAAAAAAAAAIAADNAQDAIDGLGNLDQATSTYKINAANLTVGTLSGDRISGGTITGTVLNSAASGTRVSISGTDVIFIDSNNTEVGRMRSNGTDTMAILGPSGNNITFLSNGIVMSGFVFHGGSSFTSITNSGSYTSNGSITIDGSLTRTAMAASTTRYAYVTAAGAIIAGANTPSDRRLKENISTTNLGLNFINSVDPVEFEFIDKRNPHNQGVQFGVIAQDLLQALISNGVTGDNGIVYIPELSEKDGGPDGYYLVNHEQLISPLIKAVQELSAKVEALENK